MGYVLNRDNVAITFLYLKQFPSTPVHCRWDPNPLKHIFSSWVVFLERDHLKPEIIRKKVLLSVTLEDTKITGTYKTSCRCIFFCVVSDVISVVFVRVVF